ncbi:MAG: heat-inducible transcription repressor HrcA [Clostridia bacterium]|nr:heat-inducible transcription repressor HrcA [Clostridia bacterium]
MGETELTPRKKAVLSAIVKAYIETGQPIGSKILMSLMDNAPSSATLRNEMNELCAWGFLAQPHTSAGRIPTSSAYRFYVDSLMKPIELGNTTKSYIDSKVLSVSGESQNIPKVVAGYLSDIVGYPAICSYIVGDDVILRQIELLPFSKRSAVLLIVTSDGRTLSRVCHFKSIIKAEILDGFLNFAKQRLSGKSLSEFTPVFLQNTVISAPFSFELMPVFTELFEMVNSSAKSDVSIVGSSKLYNFCNEDHARRIIDLIRRNDTFLSLLKTENTVVFGSDFPYSELFGKVLVLTDYSYKGKKCGKIGIIGPDRILYDQVIPSIEYTASRLSQIMTSVAYDMED